MAGVHREATLRALARALRAALPAWSLSPDTRVDLLNVSENTTFRLHDPDGDRRLVVRVHRPGYHSGAEIRSELAWIAALREQAVVATPAPIAGADGAFIQPLHLDAPMPLLTQQPHSISSPPRKRGSIWPLDSRFRGNDGRQSEKCCYQPTLIRSAVAFQYVPGHEPTRTDALADMFRALGAITARLHAHARWWPRPAGFVRKTWDFPRTIGDRPLWGDWRAGPGLDDAGTALLERLAGCLRLRLARFGTPPDRFGLIHADLRLTNLLVDGDALTVIDFDDCGFGWFAYDFAAAISFIEDDPAIPGLQAAWLDGYRAVAPFAREDEAEIPTFIMLRRLLLLAWIGSHTEAPEAQALGSAYTHGTLALADGFLRRYG